MPLVYEFGRHLTYTEYMWKHLDMCTSKMENGIVIEWGEHYKQVHIELYVRYVAYGPDNTQSETDR